jgi:glycosyltransferase involved in cell wall biosynthesis
MNSITFLIPTYNEAKNVANCVKAVDDYAKAHNLDYEILVIDSGSTDETLSILEPLRHSVKALKVLTQKTREGMGSALREAYPHASKDLICHYECDMPFDLCETEKALELLKGGHCDFVLGKRKGIRDHFLRILYTAGYRAFLRLCFGVNYHSINFSFKIFRRELLNKISLRSQGWFIDAELVLEMVSAGFKIKEIDIEYLKRTQGKSTVRIKDILNILGEAWSYKKKWRK